MARIDRLLDRRVLDERVVLPTLSLAKQRGNITEHEWRMQPTGTSMTRHFLMSLLALVLFQFTGCSVFVPVFVVNHSDTVVTLLVGFHDPREASYRSNTDRHVAVVPYEVTASSVKDVDSDEWQHADVRWVDSTTISIGIPPHSTLWAATTMNWLGRLRKLQVGDCDLRSDSPCTRIENPTGMFAGYHVVVHVREPTTKADQIDTASLFKDKQVTESWMKKHGVPALGVGYIKNGRLEEVQVFGELETGKPAPLNTIWNVASLTKPVTALVALRLVDAGLLQLDEPVYTTWLDPDTATDPSAKKITLRHLLSHRPGFPNWRWKNGDGKLSIQFEPGTQHQLISLPRSASRPPSSFTC